MKKVRVEGTAFNAISSVASNKDKDVIKSEKIALENSEDFVYKSADTNVQDETKTVVFDDAKSGKKVAVRLNEKTIEKLKKYFGANDVFTREDGILRLSKQSRSVCIWMVWRYSL